MLPIPVPETGAPYLPVQAIPADVAPRLVFMEVMEVPAWPLISFVKIDRLFPLPMLAKSPLRSTGR